MLQNNYNPSKGKVPIDKILGLLGGIAGSATSLIPGVGAIAGPIIGKLGSTAGQFLGRELMAYGGPIEVENKESVLRPNGQYLQFSGNTHEQGGIRYNPKMENEFVFSDRIGYNKDNRITTEQETKLSFANAVKDRLKFPRDMLKSNTVNKIKADNLKLLQKYGYGGKLKKYASGGPVFDPATLNTTIDALSDGLDNTNIPNVSSNSLASTNPNTSLLSSIYNIGKNKPLIGALPNNLLANNNASTNTISGNQPTNNTFTNQYSNLLNGLKTNTSDDLDNNKKTISKDTLAKIMKGAGLSYNLIQGLKPAQQETLRKNPFQNQILKDVNNMRFNNEAVQNRMTLEKNAQIATARDRRGPNMTSAMTANINANALQKAAEIKLQEQQMQNQLLGAKASTLNQMGEAERQNLLRMDDLNARNRAAKDSFIAETASDLSEIGTEINESGNMDKRDAIMRALTATKNLTLAEAGELMKKFDRGEISIDELSKLIIKVNQ